MDFYKYYRLSNQVGVNMNYIVYKTINLINGKIYIGIHKQKDLSFDGYYGSGILLNLAITKYGKDKFIREILYVFDCWDDARKKEKEIVDLEFCIREDTYNVSIGGGGGNTKAGMKEELKQQIIQQTKQTNIEKGNYIYLGEKLEKAQIRMLANRIQPDNFGRTHVGIPLHNMRQGYKNRTGKYCWITNGNDTNLHLIEEPIPEGWNLGRGSNVKRCESHTEETKKKISEKITGYTCYNNGIKNLKLKDGEPPPEGYIKGMLQSHNKKWITDGVTSKSIKKEEPIPSGWVQGRKIKRKM